MQTSIIPTLSCLQDHFGDDTGRDLYAVLKGRKNPLDYPTVDRWLRACYHAPSEDALKLAACDVILNGSGVEGLELPDGRDLDYVNLGDPYVATLLYYPDTKRFSVCAWGDVVEAFG